ncbi:MAG: DUF4982 domain-containing protein, partial [Flavobacteriaceae bacterium]|nr:DUF4982 domain-containing protein [Flavobacteriaceae bacterium]
MSHAQERQVFNLNSNWKFTKGNPENASKDNYNDSSWEDVIIPHDWAISGPFMIEGDGNTGKLPWKGEGWYRKMINISESYQEKRIYLIFDGIMAFPEVYVNGIFAGSWDYGYNSFYLNITKFVQFGKDNTLAIYANTKNHDSRWYPGAGIYRKIRMVVVNPVHIAIWGTYVTSPIIKPNYAAVRIRTTVHNDSSEDQKIKVEHAILSAEGLEITKQDLEKPILKGMHRDIENTLQVHDPLLWDIEHPYCYKVVTKVYVNKKLTDVDTTDFGIRSMRFTANNGFYLNDRRVQIKGVNLHHDQGPLGAAFNTRAMERQLEIMKSMGANAIRTSHNVAAPEVLDLCDKMGILVFDEIFDKYDGKADITDTTDFDAFAKRNIRNFVMRDRNHPSVFIWSVGNEIGDVQWNIDNGFEKLHTMVNYVRKYDPTRPVTLVNDNMESAKLRHFDYYDVHAWNYGRRYRLARDLEPDKSVIISESASTVSTRGFYEFPLPNEKTDFTRSLQVSSYDLNAPEWAEISDDDFMWQQDENYVAGEFVWTGFDYLGEPTPYSNQAVKELGMTDKQASRSSYFGIVDLVGIPKDRYFLYKSYWKPDETTIHILPHWNWDDRIGKNVPVFVYTNGDCAELFVNGRSQGKKCKIPDSKNAVERFRLMWPEVIYEPGEVKVIAYKQGSKLGQKIIKTVGKPYRLRLTADRMELHPGESDLSYILVEACDKDGN